MGAEHRRPRQAVPPLHGGFLTARFDDLYRHRLDRAAPTGLPGPAAG